jgi:phenylpropionate dioxygenase-like ring-hydroxylating dioxygenase large terminal subunit
MSDKSGHGLIEPPAAEAYGFLLVHPDLKGSIDAERMLVTLAPELEFWDFGSLLHIGNDTYEAKLNWKLAMDTFGETDHFHEAAQGYIGGVLLRRRSVL